MTNRERYDKIMRENLRVKQEELPGLKYRSIPSWDSIGHMDLMSALEEALCISMDTADVLDFSTYEKGMEILAKYGVEL